MVSASLLVLLGSAAASQADPTPTPTPSALPVPLPTLLPTPSPTPTPVPEAINRTVFVGTSSQGRNIYAYRRNAINPDRRVLIVGSIHGDEAAGRWVTTYLRDHTGGFDKDVEVWIIITINPDGNVLHIRQNARKVDLNRNFPYQWRYDPGQPYNSGPSEASEPETKGFVSFLKAYRPHTVIMFHQPLTCVDLSNSTREASGIMSHWTGLPMRALGTRHGSQAGYTQQLIPGSIDLTVEFGYRPSEALLYQAVKGSRAVANSR